MNTVKDREETVNALNPPDGPPFSAPFGSVDGWRANAETGLNRGGFDGARGRFVLDVIRNNKEIVREILGIYHEALNDNR